jgi:hypothetical protein
MSYELVRGSIGDLVRNEDRYMRDVMMNVTEVLLVDTSGSMNARDAGSDGEQRYTVAVRELKNVQGQYPGRCAVFSFSTNCQFEFSGVPMFSKGGTHMDKAFKTLQPFAGTDLTVHVISDGLPNSVEKALKAAKALHLKINPIYIGPIVPSSADPIAREVEAAQIAKALQFMQDLASLTGGTAVTSEVKLLGDNVQRLIEAAD